MIVNLQGITLEECGDTDIFTRHLDNLFFQFITSDDSAIVLDVLSHDMRKRLPLVMEASPPLRPPSPNPSFSGKLNQTSPSFRLDETFSHSMSFASKSLREAGSRLAIKISECKIATYGKIDTRSLPADIVEYQDDLLDFILHLYPDRVMLHDEIPIPLLRQRSRIQEIYEFSNLIPKWSVFLDNGTTPTSAARIPVHALIAEELFGLPRMVGGFIFGYLTGGVCEVPLEGITEDTAARLRTVPAALSASLLQTVYTLCCRGCNMEERLYNLLCDKALQDAVAYYDADTISARRREALGILNTLQDLEIMSSSSAISDTLLAAVPDFTVTASPYGRAIPLAKLVLLSLSLIVTHPAYDFVQPFVYQRSLALIATARIFFDCDLHGRWLLSYEDTYLRHGVSLSDIYWRAQMLENIVGETGPFGYEQFYVIYCAFVKHSDEDIEGDITSLATYNNSTYSALCCAEIMRGRGRPFYKTSAGYSASVAARRPAADAGAGTGAGTPSSINFRASEGSVGASNLLSSRGPSDACRFTSFHDDDQHIDSQTDLTQDSESAGAMRLSDVGISVSKMRRFAMGQGCASDDEDDDGEGIGIGMGAAGADDTQLSDIPVRQAGASPGRAPCSTRADSIRPWHRLLHMTLVDFVIFMISEVASDSHAAVYYWYQIADHDADGVIGGADIRYYVQDQLQLWDLYGLDLLPEDVFCQLTDMIKYTTTETFSLAPTAPRRPLLRPRTGAGGSSGGGSGGGRWQPATAHNNYRLFECLDERSAWGVTAAPTGVCEDEIESVVLTLKDLSRSQVAVNLYHCLFSAQKFALFEQRDTFLSMSLRQQNEESRRCTFPRAHYDSYLWQTITAATYEQLVADE